MNKVLRVHLKDNIIILFIIVCVSLSTVYASFKNAAVINSIIQLDIASFTKNVLMLLVAYGLFLFFTYLKILKIGRTIQKMSTYLRDQITNKVFNTSYENFHKKDSGTYVSWLTNDIAQIEQAGFSQFYELLSGIILTVFSAVALLSIHWSLLLLTIIELIIIIQIPKIFGKKIEKSTIKLTSENEKFVSKTTDIIASFDTMFVYRRFYYVIEKMKKSSKELGRQKNNQTKVMALVAISGGIGNILGQVSILTLSGYLALISVISIGAISASSQFASEIFNTVGNLSQYLASIDSTKPLFQKFDDIKVNNETNNAEFLLNKGIEIKNLQYSYGERRILNGITFSFELNKKYAILGESGSGKSTLLNILAGKLQSYEGEVILGNKNISQISTDQLYNQLLYIDQNPYVYNGTIRENLCLDEEFSDEEIYEVLKKINLKDTVNKLEKGLDTDLGEKGRIFSGGQLQRLTLARGLLRDKKIVLLDEGTSKLDTVNSKLIEKLLVKQKDITLIMVTHHLDTDIEKRLDGILYL